MKTICSFIFLLIVTESFQGHDISNIVGSYSHSEIDYVHWLALNSDSTFKEGESGCVQWEYKYEGKWIVSGDTITLKRMTITDVIEEYVHPEQNNVETLKTPIVTHYLYSGDSLVPIRQFNEKRLSNYNLVKFKE